MKFNGNTLSKIRFNGQDISKMIHNGIVKTFASQPVVPATPSAPVLELKTYNSVQVVYTMENEYSLNGTIWQDSALFESLSPSTAYTIYQRVKAVDLIPASLTSPALSATTDATPILMPNLLNEDGNMWDITTVDNKPDGWVYSNSSAVSCVNNEATFIASATNGYIRKRPTMVVGDIYYACAFVRSDSSLTRLYLVGDYASHSGGGDYEFLSALYTCSSTTNQMDIRDTRSSAWTNISVKLAFMFNLTAIFGTGYEPTEAQMKAWMSYYIGENGYASSLPYGTPPAELPAYGAPWATEYTKPTALNTGYGVTVLTADSGIIPLNTSNVVYENKNLSGYITIGAGADNVIIRNCKITPPDGSYYCVQIYSGTNILIENCEFDMSACLSTGSAAVTGTNYIARACYIHDSGADGLKLGSNVTIEGCYIERLGRRVGAHADGMQLSGGSNVIIRRNNIHMPANVNGFIATSNLMIKPDASSIDNILIENNWFNGGGYTIYVTDATSYATTNAVVENNRFGRDYNYGPKQLTASAGVSWLNNVWLDTNIIIS